MMCGGLAPSENVHARIARHANVQRRWEFIGKLSTDHVFMTSSRCYAALGVLARFDSDGCLHLRMLDAAFRAVCRGYARVTLPRNNCVS